MRGCAEADHNSWRLNHAIFKNWFIQLTVTCIFTCPYGLRVGIYMNPLPCFNFLITIIDIHFSLLINGQNGAQITGRVLHFCFYLKPWIQLFLVQVINRQMGTSYPEFKLV